MPWTVRIQDANNHLRDLHSHDKELESLFIHIFQTDANCKIISVKQEKLK